MDNPSTPIITTWSIVQLERHTADGIVYTAHWTVNATTEGASAGAYGSNGLEAPAEGDPIIPFEDLTEKIVIDWVKDALGEEQVASTEAALATQIAEQLTPKSASGVPW
jgi:hypothetical protein